jgi:hypothetical protein
MKTKSSWIFDGDVISVTRHTTVPGTIFVRLFARLYVFCVTDELQYQSPDVYILYLLEPLRR